jgi:hypothetical protein
MNRFTGLLLAGVVSLAAVDSAFAGTSLLGDGYTNWFYACSAGRMMNLAIRHTDGTMTRFSLGPGDEVRGPVQRGDVVAWRCGGPVDPNARFIYIVTLQ